MDTSITKSYWNDIVLAFPILSKNEKNSEKCDDEQFLAIKKTIVENKLISFVHGMVTHKIKQDLMSKINDFWLYFMPYDVVELSYLLPSDDVSGDFSGFEKFKCAVDELFNLAQSYVETINRLQMLFENNKINLLKNLNAQICALLHSTLPSDYNKIIYQFYRVALKVFTKEDMVGDKKNTSKDGTFNCIGCSAEVISCKCDYILESFHLTNWQLITIGILEPLAGDVIMDLIHQTIESEVQDTTKDNFGEHHISDLENWIDKNVYNWVKYVYIPKHSKITNIADINLAIFMRKLKHLLYESYTRTRIDQLFNIIIEYPDSEPAVIDLSFTLHKTDFKPELCKKLQNALHSRLLHPAVNTIDIITAYTAAIKVLRKIDPCGALLQEVTQPIRAYLRSRKDTVRCVMTTLTEEGHYLTDELVRNENVLDEDDVCEEESMVEWAKWTPDPVDANPSKSSKRFRNSDTVSMLVDIYGTRELFVNEYRALLADRLLTQFMDNIGDEIRYLELLKLRFGDSLLHSCSVMLKDVYDSKRINHHLYSDPTSNLSSNNLNNKLEFPVKAIIVSNQFWPNFKDNFNVELPSVIQEHLDNYTKAFESFKGNRTLNWKPNLGIINIDLVLKDKTLNFTVSPIHATIIWHFQEQEEWTINDLSIKMRVPATTLRRRIGFWQNQGLLREKSFDSFIFVEDGIPTTSISGKGNRTSFVGRNSEFVYGDDDDEMESAVASAQDQREEELQVFWSYIVGMLTNLDSLPLDRIHQMLKMFATQGTGVDCSLTQLRLFLDEKVKQHLLIFTGGFVDIHDESNIILKHYSNNGKQLAESRWAVNKNKFKIIIELKIGDNMLVFKISNEVLHTKLVYKQRVTNYTVCPVYVICADHDGRFQAPVDYDNSVQNACTKITLCSKLIQMLTAEKMYEKGFGKKTFQVEKECRIIKSSLTRRTVFNMHPEKLWEYIARELTNGQNSKTRKYLAFLSCTYWDGQNLHGHVALGGGGLALFGTGCLYTWPSKLEEVLPCFMNMAKVDTGSLLDDSCFRGNFGGCFSTTLGSVWHELGHTFDLGHSKYGIMGRGFDNVHLIFTLDNKNIAQEIKPANKGYIICIENYSNTINMKDDMSNNNNTNGNEAIDEYDSKHIICWSMGCASILSFHKWFNDFKEENNNENTIDYVAKRNLLTSRNGLRVVQLRREDGLVMHSWEFVKNNNKRTFILPVQLANNGITIIAEDSCGNILKHLL